LNRRRLIILSFSLICLVLIIGGFLYWQFEQWAEQKLQDYIERLEDLGYTTEEHSLTDFHVDGSVKIPFFGDFRSFARQEDIDHIYFDRGIHALYFLHNVTEDRVEANIFHYK